MSSSASSIAAIAVVRVLATLAKTSAALLGSIHRVSIARPLRIGQGSSDTSTTLGLVGFAITTKRMSAALVQRSAALAGSNRFAISARPHARLPRVLRWLMVSGPVDFVIAV